MDMGHPVKAMKNIFRIRALLPNESQNYVYDI